MEYSLKEIIKIDNRFEKSVNLSLDLDDAKKISSYIPTRSSNNILAGYIQSVTSPSDNRANILVGPYGKGKSHLLLVLLSILSQKNNRETKSLIKRMIKVSPELENTFNSISDIKPFLPIIVNPGEGSLNKSFYKALIMSLHREGFSDIIPDSYYSKAIETIQKWKREYPDTYSLFELKIGDVELALNRLEKLDEDSLKNFISIYPSLTAGSEFNPFLEDDIVAIIRSVNKQLHEKKNYAGIYIVFDEFSKYIEGHKIDQFAEDMKTLQDICELCAFSKKEQVHITCVAHKSIKSYGNSLPKEILNSFEGVAGRLSEILFVVSSKNNYELIADAIGKTELFSDFIKTNTTYKDVTADTYKLKAFNSLFTEKDYKKIVAEGCYPLTPVSSMLLLELCEKIAQNERTLFTFITGKERNSLSRAINRNKKASYIGIDTIYDYFEEAFKDDNSNIHKEWLKAEYSISKVSNDIDIKLIKTLAIINMTNVAGVGANDLFFRLSLGLNENEIEKAIERLTNEKIIVYKNISKAYEFKNNVGIDIDAEIDDCIKKFYSKLDLADVLNSVNENKYIIPKKHNQINCITRYFSNIFITGQQFEMLNNIDYLGLSNVPDGYAFFIIPDGTSQKNVNEHLIEMNLDNALLVFPETKNSIIEKAQKILAIRHLKSNKDFTENNSVLIKELNSIDAETKTEINNWIKETYLSPQKYYTNKGRMTTGIYGLNRAISDICDEVYCSAPVINNELINRHSISPQIQRARNTIIVEMLKDEDFSKYQEGTSAEATIYRAVFNSNTINTMSNAMIEIDSFVTSAIGKKQKFDIIVNKLLRVPFGMRKGVIPLYILDSLMKLNGTPVIYLNNKEVLLDEESIINIINKPSDYYLFIESKNAKKDAYLNKLEQLFLDYSNYCKEIDSKNKINRVSCLMQSWYRSLPQATVLFSTPDKKQQSIKIIQAFRALFTDFYLNPREMLFEKLPVVFNTKDLDSVFSEIKSMKQALDAHIHSLKVNVVGVIRECFKFPQNANLSKSLIDWYNSVPENTKNSVFNGTDGELLAYLSGEISSDEESIADVIAKIVTRSYIEDWNDNVINEFEEKLKQFVLAVKDKKLNISESQKITFITDDGNKKDCFVDYDPSSLSTSGSFLKNALIDTLDEFGDVTDNSEKIGILLEIAKELMKK